MNTKLTVEYDGYIYVFIKILKRNIKVLSTYISFRGKISSIRDSNFI